MPACLIRDTGMHTCSIAACVLGICAFLMHVNLHVCEYVCVSAPLTVEAWCCLMAGGWLERVKADNQGEFHDAHTSCSLKFY